ncbi:GyrI-like domain-containing protein [Flavobacterium selenitireducens]|uniref:GyrI-like domain-containing protein n=1 Tax=Flavobacterium selenitireducens TaxID=2722704 RepID=UPI00168B1E89|nr:GyrI-like domain-containing protein [Flavobacterium selenitireducens]MBD3581080.1 GyrI-like domain-containing protein [Flavobacterium selenitireducens]
MFLRLDTFPDSRLIGRNLEMSFAHDRTPALWKSFMPDRHQLQNARGNDLISLQVYPRGFDFSDPQLAFVKWSGVIVPDGQKVPSSMEALEIPQGRYAVFLHSGSPTTAADTFNYIFREWLPSSGFELDERPHFEILGEKYDNNSANSEEEIWIPIRPISGSTA